MALVIPSIAYKRMCWPYRYFARRVSLIFGAITMVSGLLGVALGSALGTTLVKPFPRAHPIICGVGLLVSAPALALALTLVREYFLLTFILIFIAETALNLNWAIVADMSMVRVALYGSVLVTLSILYVLEPAQTRNDGNSVNGKVSELKIDKDVT